MSLVAVVVLLAIVEYVVFGALVGRARTKYQVKAPATTGNEMFERYFRVHYNSLEQLIIFIPSVWFFATYISNPWAAGLGAVFLVARILYAVGYIKDPGKREVGALLTAVVVLILLLGALYGAIRAAFG